MTLEDIKKTIEGAIPDCTAYVLDPMADGQHLEALVISPAFKDKMLVQQHQMVMKSLKAAFQGPVHALGLKTFTPEKWEAERGKYGL